MCTHMSCPKNKLHAHTYVHMALTVSVVKVGSLHPNSRRRYRTLDKQAFLQGAPLQSTQPELSPQRGWDHHVPTALDPEDLGTQPMLPSVLTLGCSPGIGLQG